MALFIEVVVDPAIAKNAEQVAKLVEACPVDIFAKKKDGSLQIRDENLDECTLCELCLSVGKPGQVKVRKLYEDGKALERSA